MKLSIGPGALVAAAFIGPGTVTACTLAGANFGYALVWALVFATLATIVFQEMAARLGIGAGMGLGEALVSKDMPRAFRWAAAALVLVALAMGNAAYEAGNLTGGALGLLALADQPQLGQRAGVAVICVIAGAALMIGRYKLLENLLIALVLIMSLAFAASLLLVRPDFGALLSGLVPKLPAGSLLTAMALIGTTIVPYNLFLHAATVRQRWPGGGASALQDARVDTVVSIGLGGLISILILSTAAGSLFGSGMVVRTGADLAASLEPAYGAAARWLVGTGLLAAGLSSAITAPLATAHAVREIAGLSNGGWAFKSIALAVLVIGAILAVLGIKPQDVIVIAQVANGLLLPIVAAFLLVAMNRRTLLGEQVNGAWSNILGGAVLVVSTILGLRLILRALGIWP